MRIYLDVCCFNRPFDDQRQNRIRLEGTHWRSSRKGMKSDAEIRQAGMQALTSALGAVDAERFFASISRDRFDSTEWRRSGLQSVDLQSLSREAEQFSRSLDNAQH